MAISSRPSCSRATPSGDVEVATLVIFKQALASEVLLLHVQRLLEGSPSSIREDAVPRPPRVGTTCGVQFSDPRNASAFMRYLNDAEYSYVVKASGVTHPVAASITKPDDQRSCGRALEPAFKAILDAGFAKKRVRPRHYEKGSKHFTSLYILDEEAAAQLFAVVHYGSEGGRTIIEQIDLSRWAQDSHAELATSVLKAAGFGANPMDTA